MQGIYYNIIIITSVSSPSQHHGHTLVVQRHDLQHHQQQKQHWYHHQQYMFIVKIINKHHYPLARNQYINNSPEIVSCIHPGANTRAACICSRINSPKIYSCIGITGEWIRPLYPYRERGRRCEYIFAKFRIHISKVIPQEYSPVFAQVRIQAPHVFATNHFSKVFSCMCWFCARNWKNGSSIQSASTMTTSPTMNTSKLSTSKSTSIAQQSHRSISMSSASSAQTLTTSHHTSKIKIHSTSST